MKKKNGLLIKLIFPFIVILILSTIFNILLFGYFFNAKLVNAVNINPAELKKIFFLFFAIISILQTIIIILFYTYFIRRIMILPLKKIINYISNVSSNDMSYRMIVDRTDEFGELQIHFNGMIEKLKKTMLQIEQMRDRNFKLEKLQILSNLSSGIAHEINNPINNISLDIEVLKKMANFPEKIKEYCDKIDSELLKISSITKKFSEFSKLSVNNIVQTRLKNIFDEIFEMLGYYRLTKNYEVEFIDKTNNREYKIYKEPLKFILINLIKNAIEALPEKYGKLKIEISEDAAHLIIKIMDNGCGIDKNAADKIFEPFFTTKENGSGLGLAISKKLAELCRAIIECERNTENTGMTFILKIGKISQ